MLAVASGHLMERGGFVDDPNGNVVLCKCKRGCETAGTRSNLQICCEDKGTYDEI